MLFSIEKGRGQIVSSLQSPPPARFYAIAALRPNSGLTDPRIAAPTIFLMLCAAQTCENSPATLDIPRTRIPGSPCS